MTQRRRKKKLRLSDYSQDPFEEDDPKPPRTKQNVFGPPNSLEGVKSALSNTRKNLAKGVGNLGKTYQGAMRDWDRFSKSFNDAPKPPKPLKPSDIFSTPTKKRRKKKPSSDSDDMFTGKGDLF